MKQLILIFFAINLFHAQEIHNCGSENTQIRFHSVDYRYSASQLHFRLQGRANADVNTDYLQIRVYGGAPEYTILGTERFAYFAFSFSSLEQLKILDFADFYGLETNKSYNVQVDVLDANDNQIGCARFPWYKDAQQ